MRQSHENYNPVHHNNVPRTVCQCLWQQNNANAYGARGTYRIKGTHHYEKRDGAWITVNR